MNKLQKTLGIGALVLALAGCGIKTVSLNMGYKSDLVEAVNLFQRDVEKIMQVEIGDIRVKSFLETVPLILKEIDNSKLSFYDRSRNLLFLAKKAFGNETYVYYFDTNPYIFYQFGFHNLTHPQNLTYFQGIHEMVHLGYIKKVGEEALADLPKDYKEEIANYLAGVIMQERGFPNVYETLKKWGMPEKYNLSERFSKSNLLDLLLHP